jgi:hypothetical protein
MTTAADLRAIPNYAPPWHQDAACLGQPADLSFPAIGRGGAVAAIVAPARTFCDRCESRRRVRAGTTPRQRQRLRRAQRGEDPT